MPYLYQQPTGEHRETIDFNWHSLNVQPSDATSYNVQNLSQDTSYEFYVRAKNIIGEGPRSPIVIASTKRALTGSLAPIRIDQDHDQVASGTPSGKLSISCCLLVTYLAQPKNNVKLPHYSHVKPQLFPPQLLSSPSLSILQLCSLTNPLELIQNRNIATCPFKRATKTRARSRTAPSR